MRVLILDGYPPVHPDRGVVRVVADALVERGHEPDVLELHEGHRGRPMTEAERRAYHEDDNRVSDEIREAADHIAAADAMVFCYPTTTFTVPATMKAWMEKAFLPGVGFVFNDAGKLRPGMTQVRRLALVTTTPHGRLETARARDGGHRTILWTLRMNCHPRCRRTKVVLPSGGAAPETSIRRAFRRW